MVDNSEEIKDVTLSSLFEDIRQELLDYIRIRMRLLKLDIYEKGSKASSSLGYGLVVLSIVGFFLFFVLVGLAFFIGELIGSIAAGFGVMALVSLITLMLVYVFRKKVQRGLMNKMILFFRKVEADED